MCVCVRAWVSACDRERKREKAFFYLCRHSHVWRRSTMRRNLVWCGLKRILLRARVSECECVLERERKKERAGEKLKVSDTVCCFG